MILIYIFAVLTFLLLFYDGRIPQTKMPIDEKNHTLSLLTLVNEANAPFYYHTTILLTERVDNLNFTKSYGFYPDHRNDLPWIWPLNKIYRLIRPIFPMEGKIRSPDPLFWGLPNVINPEKDHKYIIQPGTVRYREEYPITLETLEELRVELENRNQRLDPLYYSYYAKGESDNCSSWARKLIDRYLNIDLSCRSYRFRFLGLNWAIPLSFVDFPMLCSSH